MNPETIPVRTTADFALAPILIFIVVPFIGFLVTVALARSGFRTASLSARFQFAREFGWLAVPFVVIASFGMTTAPGEILSQWGLPRNEIIPRSSPFRSVAPAAVDGPHASARTGSTAARPNWMDQPRVVEGDCERIVIFSHQYSTREEAEPELRSAAVKLVEEDLRRFQTGGFRPRSWSPAAEDVIAHAVTAEYDEVAERDFGSFTHPMHRVSWLVELSPAMRTEFMPAWRRAVISFRILLVAGVASLFAMAASASVMYFRLDALTQGRARGVLKLLTGGALASWLGLVATSVSQGHLW